MIRTEVISRLVGRIVADAAHWGPCFGTVLITASASHLQSTTAHPKLRLLRPPCERLPLAYLLRARSAMKKPCTEEIEDSYDDTTKIRTMTEQAMVSGQGLLLRTTVYSPHHLSVNVIFVPGAKPFDPVVGCSPPCARGGARRRSPSRPRRRPAIPDLADAVPGSTRRSRCR